jgi:hypothetical protein
MRLTFDNGRKEGRMGITSASGITPGGGLRQSFIVFRDISFIIPAVREVEEDSGLRETKLSLTVPRWDQNSVRS